MPARYLIRSAVQSLRKGGLRSALTMLGLAIGIASVVILVGVGEGSSQKVRDDIHSMGGDVIVTYLFEQNILYPDLQSIARDNNVGCLSPAKLSGKKVTRNNRISNRAVTEGVDEHAIEVRNLSIARGRNLSSLDREQKSRVAVIGSNLAHDLFGENDPLGNAIKLDGERYTVVGILEPQGNSLGTSVDHLALVPYTTLDGDSSFDSFYARSAAGDIEGTKHVIRQALIDQFGIAPDRVSVMSQDEMLRAEDNIDGTLTLLLVGIASISLVVAGIGVMNVMLVSVTERTREIGIRKAIGARDRDILAQFLLEAIILSLLGGMLGIAVSGSFGFMAHGAGIAFSFSRQTVLVAIVVSSITGIVSGILPARRASRQNPIDALRSM